MAQGQPALMTWAPGDGNIRMFRLAETGWIQTGIVSAPHVGHASNRPSVGFVNDSKIAWSYTQFNTTAAGVMLRTYDLDLNVKEQLQSLPIGATDAITRCAAPKFPLKSHVHLNKSGVTTVAQYPIGDNGEIGANTSLFNANHGPGKCQSDLGDFMYISVSGTSHRTIPRSGFHATYGTPVFANGGPQSFPWTVAPMMCTYAHNSQFLYVMFTQAARNRFEIYLWAAADAFETTPVASISEAGVGTVSNMAVRPNDRHVVLTWDNGSGYFQSYLYRRVGTSFSKIYTWPVNFGRQLSWTEDGKYLIDATVKKMYEISEDGLTITDRSSLMSAIPAGVEIQATSTHALAPVAQARVYLGGLAALVSNGVNLSQLKVMLLNSNAGFMPEHTTINQVSNTNAYQVSGSGWAAGGELLTGVARETIDSGLAIRWKANVLQKNIVTAPITFRRACIYDASNSKPIVMLDFLTDYVAPIDTTLKFDFLTNGFVKFST